MLKVKYIEKGCESDFRRIDHENYLIARSYFENGSLYYFRINEFEYKAIAKEDIIYIMDLG